MGEDAVLEAGEEDDRELEALGGVEGHQRDDAGVVAVGGVGDLVGVGDQGDPLEEVAEADGDGARLDLGRVGARPRLRVLGELAGHRDELGEVLHAGAVLRVVARLELGEVARALEHGLEDDVGALVGLDHRLQLLDDRDERLDVLQAARGQARAPSAARVSASQKVIRSRSARAAMHASARSPMPRLGVLSTRRSEISSAVLTSIRR